MLFIQQWRIFGLGLRLALLLTWPSNAYVASSTHRASAASITCITSMPCCTFAARATSSTYGAAALLWRYIGYGQAYTSYHHHRCC